MCDRTQPPPRVRGLDHYLPVDDGCRFDAMRMLTIFTGAGCNLRCPYCFTGQWQKGEGEVSYSNYAALMEDARELGSQSIWWVGQGEPFLVPYWKDLIRAAQRLGLWIGIFTNGTRLDGQASEFVTGHGVSLYVKLNSFRPDTQGRLIGGDGKAFLDHIIPRIEWFADRGMAAQRRLAVESVITKLNYEEIPSLFRWCRDRRIIPFIEMMEHACKGAIELDVSPEQHVALFRELQRIDREEYGYEWEIVPPWAAYRCRNLYLGLAADAWGNVTPCSGMRYSLGNIRDRALEDIWNSEDAKRLRNPAVQEPQPWDGQSLGCYGCKSHAYHVTGDSSAIDPRCDWFKSTELGTGVRATEMPK